MENLSQVNDLKTLNTSIKEETITVSQLNKLAKTLLESNMPVCWIRGEISGVKAYSHIYFDLKDESAKVSCVVFAGNIANIDFKLENGVKVEVRGRVTIYPQNGSYQINIERIRKLGMGDLWEAYNQLVDKLRDEGLFDAKYKKPIPVFPKSIGVITSKEGAVIRDVITTLRRRMPNIPIVVYHTAVQGQDAAMQISKAIRQANKRKDVDVLIVCRGGGSREDLWCFNEEVVAREVFASSIPVISAVGHETDTTIIDFVADLRTPTPTAAAELVAKGKKEWDMIIGKLHSQLLHKFDYIMNDRKQRLDLYYKQLRVLNPINQFRERRLKVLNLSNQLLARMSNTINTHTMRLQKLDGRLNVKQINLSAYRSKLKYLDSRMSVLVKVKLNNFISNLERLKGHLELVNPYNILSRGYAIVRDTDGRVINNGKNTIHNQKLQIQFKDDLINATVDKIE